MPTRRSNSKFAAASRVSAGSSPSGMNSKSGSQEVKSRVRRRCLHPARSTPVTLGGEIDDAARVGELPGLEHEHPTRLHLGLLARRLVSLEIVREGPLELKRDPASHHPDAIHGVDQGIGVLAQNIAMWWSSTLYDSASR